MTTYTLQDGGIIAASCPADFVTKLRYAAFRNSGKAFAISVVSAVWVTSSAHFSAAGELEPMCEKKAAIWA